MDVINSSPLIARSEWRRVALFAAVIVALVMLPYAVGWARQTDEMRFRGAVIAGDDFSSYLGKMRLGARGIWDFHLFYTPEPHDAVAGVFLPYIAAGQIVGLFYQETDPALTSGLIITYHAMRIAFTLVLLVVLYRFIACFLRSPSQRITALILSVVGGGFGWLVILLPGGGDWLGSLPPDMFIPEGFGFIIPLALPHLALARALLLLGFLALFTAMRQTANVTDSSTGLAGHTLTGSVVRARRALPTITLHRLYAAVIAGVCWAGVGIIVPFYLAVIYCLLAAWAVGLLIKLRKIPYTLLLYGGLAAAITLPLFAYYALAFARNQAFAAWSAQNLLPAPHPLQYLVAYSIFIALAAFALRWTWRRGRRRGEYILLLTWVIAAFVLVYLPINVQRRMSEAVIVPLAILAAHGLAVALRWRVRKAARRRVRGGVLTLASLTSALLLITTTFGALSLSHPVFIPRGQLDAFAWLDSNAPPDTRILAAMPTGNVLPAYTHMRPYVGHGPETLGALAKEAETERFYADGMSTDERAALYASVDIRYVFYGTNERALASETNVNADAPAWAEDLTLVYEADGVQVFAVDGR